MTQTKPTICQKEDDKCVHVFVIETKYLPVLKAFQSMYSSTSVFISCSGTTAGNDAVLSNDFIIVND